MIPFALVLYGLLSSRCQVNGLLPDAACTPGDIETTDVNVVCGQLTSARRRVSEATKRRVFVEYGIDPRQPPGAYEIDHLVSLELGGSNDISNLWPESAPGFHTKDVIENELHRRVCSGRMKLVDAQREIANDWTAIK